MRSLPTSSLVDRFEKAAGVLPVFSHSNASSRIRRAFFGRLFFVVVFDFFAVAAAFKSKRAPVAIRLLGQLRESAPNSPKRFMALIRGLFRANDFARVSACHGKRSEDLAFVSTCHGKRSEDLSLVSACHGKSSTDFARVSACHGKSATDFARVSACHGKSSRDFDS